MGVTLRTTLSDFPEETFPNVQVPSSLSMGFGLTEFTTKSSSFSLRSLTSGIVLLSWLVSERFIFPGVAMFWTRGASAQTNTLMAESGTGFDLQPRNITAARMTKMETMIVGFLFILAALPSIANNKTYYLRAYQKKQGRVRTPSGE